MNKEKEVRSAAQRAADLRYFEKNPKRTKSVTFNFSTAEAEKIEKELSELITAGIVSSKADFLRKALIFFKSQV
jgi:predicted HTH transcriptional regulator